MGRFMRAGAEIAEKGTFTEKLGNGYSGGRIEQDVPLNALQNKNAAGQMHAAARSVGIADNFRRYLLAGGVAAGGLSERFIPFPRGPQAAVRARWSGPVVVPCRYWVARGVKSRMPGAAAGGDVCGVF